MEGSNCELLNNTKQLLQDALFEKYVEIAAYRQFVVLVTRIQTKAIPAYM